MYFQCMHKYVFQCTKFFSSAQMFFSVHKYVSVHTKVSQGKIIPGTQWAKNGRQTLGLDCHWGLAWPVKLFAALRLANSWSIECSGDLRNIHRIEVLKIWMNWLGTIFKRGFRTKICCCFIKVLARDRNVYAKSLATIAWHGLKRRNISTTSRKYDMK